LDENSSKNEIDLENRRPRNRFWKRFGITLVIVFAVLTVIAEVVLKRAEPILKGRVIETLSTRFNSKVELDNLDVSLLRGLQVSGDGLRIYSPPDVVAAGATAPLIAIRHFSFHARLLGLFIKPTHVGAIQVSGLQIHIPPKSERKQNGGAGSQYPARKGKIKIVADEIVCDDSELIIGTDKPGKDPKHFVLKHIVLENLSSNSAMTFDATLTNAIPRGNIHAAGSFGPWVDESPGDSGVSGRYTFDHADLNTIKGLGGMLSSEGIFQGQLDRIDVNGTTKTPNFSLDIAQHPVSLETHFQAIVDGLSGDTYLHSVEAKLGHSTFSCNGKVVNIKGQGHVIDLDVHIPAGRIEDFLLLAVKTTPVVMHGLIHTDAKLHIPPGKVSVAQKMQMQGAFSLEQIQFTNAQWQDKIDMLSLRAQGEPELAHPGAAKVNSGMTGHFALGAGKLTFSSLDYEMPGANVDLAGVYTLDGQKFEFAGTVRTKAKLSQMVSTWWKTLLLTPVDPFFAKHGAGTEIPVKISGTKSAPKFGLDLDKMH
jgi:hypothetical protein